MLTRRMLVAGALTLGALATTTTHAGGSPDCPWDCAGLPGIVNVDEFLAVLAGWGTVGGPCDFDGDGIGIDDFLAVLARWGPCPVPANDDCDATVTLDRSDPDGAIIVPFEMLGATASPEALECLGGSHSDIWYCLANSSGAGKTADVSVDVPMGIEVTEGCACPPGPVVACTPDGVAGLSLTLQAGESVTIRLVNVDDLPHDQLGGELTIQNTTLPTGGCCLADDACVVTNQADCEAQGGVYEGDDAPCDPNPCGPTGACCYTDGTCDDTITQAQCEAGGGFYEGDGVACDATDCPPGCGDPDAGDCCQATGSPGCESFDCCQTVCVFDGFCCDTEWDALCAETALQFSDECGCLQLCDAGKTPENEPDCGVPEDTVNGGCLVSPPVFTTVTCGDQICGTGRSGPNARDTDWYRLVLTDSSTLVTWTVTASFPLQMGLVQYQPGSLGSGNCADITGQLAPVDLAAPGQTASITVCLPPGIWYFFAAAIMGSNVACGAEYNASISCQPFCATCGTPSDGACCFANFTPGCEDIDCCAAICADDPFCCDVSWDTLCGQMAGLEPACGCGG